MVVDDTQFVEVVLAMSSLVHLIFHKSLALKLQVASSEPLITPCYQIITNSEVGIGLKVEGGKLVTFGTPYLILEEPSC